MLGVAVLELGLMTSVLLKIFAMALVQCCIIYIYNYNFLKTTFKYVLMVYCARLCLNGCAAAAIATASGGYVV